jgi:hypothetical protein
MAFGLLKSRFDQYYRPAFASRQFSSLSPFHALRLAVLMRIFPAAQCNSRAWGS